MSGTILIVDDVATNRIVMKVKLAAACYRVLQAGDIEAAQQIARTGAPDLILAGLTLRGADGAALAQRLAADPATREIPVVLMAEAPSIEARRRALSLGAADVICKPVDEAYLLARLRSLMRARDAAEEMRLRDSTARALGLAEPATGYERPGLVAIVAARPETALLWRAELSRHLPHRVVTQARAEALAEPAAAVADLFVIGPGGTRPAEALRLMSELRSRPATRHAAICLVLPGPDAELAAMALDLGADEVAAAPFDAAELALRLGTLIRRKRRLDGLRSSMRDGLRQAVTDPLTGLYNRRYALPHLGRMIERARQGGRRLAVMALDLDRFKQVNDTWGHAAGDRVLIAVAQRLAERLRPVDLLARIGGEEFLAALPDVTMAEAASVAERLRLAVEAQPVETGPNAASSVATTVSIGLVHCDPAASPVVDAAELTELADRALLAAKAEGRNQVTIARSAA